MKVSLLDSLYDTATSELPLVGTPEKMAVTYNDNEKLIRHYTILSGATGFVCGLPGYASMAITVPSNIAGLALLQLHMCAALAIQDGRDPDQVEVKRLCVDAIVNASPESRDRQEKETRGWVKRLTVKVGERGLRFAGEQSLKWMGKGARSLPLLGGVVGGISDVRSTQSVASRAQRLLSQHDSTEAKVAL